MPIYEYRCDKCKEEFELFRSITDNGNPTCKSCGGPVKKLISRTSFHLKGTGWYVTDYAGKKPADQEEKKETKSESSSATSKKEESTPKKGADPSD